MQLTILEFQEADSQIKLDFTVVTHGRYNCCENLLKNMGQILLTDFGSFGNIAIIDPVYFAGVNEKLFQFLQG